MKPHISQSTTVTTILSVSHLLSLVDVAYCVIWRKSCGRFKRQAEKYESYVLFYDCKILWYDACKVECFSLLFLFEYTLMYHVLSKATRSDSSISFSVSPSKKEETASIWSPGNSFWNANFWARLCLADTTFVAQNEGSSFIVARRPMKKSWAISIIPGTRHKNETLLQEDAVRHCKLLLFYWKISSTDLSPGNWRFRSCSPDSNDRPHFEWRWRSCWCWIFI